MSDVGAKNINSNFFDGYYKDIWRTLMPDALTNAEVDYLVNEAQLEPGDKVLDLMCGYGRHALLLARLGVNVTAVDNLIDYVNEIKEIAQKERLPITALQEDVIQFQSRVEYDLVVCMGSNLSFFNLDESKKLFSSVESSLAKGGKFIFNTWMVTEIALKQFQEKAWSYVGDLRYLVDSKYLFSPARIETETIMTGKGGDIERKKSVDYIYSLNETENMLDSAGLKLKEIWSIPGKKRFALGQPRAYIVAEKAKS